MKPRNRAKRPKQEGVPRIEEVLAKVGKRVELAARLGLSESRISEYIAGKRVPTSDAWLKLGRLALEYGLPDPFFFWSQAGLDPQTLRSMNAKVFEEQRSLMGETVPIPRFRATEQGREEAGPPVPLPKECIPNPSATICLSVRDDEQSAAIIDAPRGLFILDTSMEGTDRLENLWDRVIAIHFDRRQWASRFPKGIYVGRLIEMLPIQAAHQSTAVNVSGALLSLTGNEMYERIFIGEYQEPEALQGISPEDSEARKRRMTEVWERARVNLRLDKAVRILGKVIGRLSGHLTD
jgi:transcriptional regulator with XRE-family HTH domain